MKKVSLLLGLIFLISAFTSQGQIVTKYQQGFEATGETSSYTVVQGSAVPVTTVASSGERSLKLSQSTSSEVIIMLDTLDFTDNGSYPAPKAEQMLDYELGYQFAGEAVRAGANFYFMDYTDQFVQCARSRHHPDSSGQ